jgi:PilZ domain-containing protein
MNVLAEVTCTWGEDDTTPNGQTTAALVHMSQGMLVLEASDPRQTLPPLGTRMYVTSDAGPMAGRLAEHGRGGRFLLSLGDRPVRRAARLRVSLPATLRYRSLAEPLAVEIVDLTTGGARIRGVELPVGTQLTLAFTPPGRTEPVSVRAVVAHGTHGAQQPWIGVLFRLVALKGGR